MGTHHVEHTYYSPGGLTVGELSNFLAKINPPTDAIVEFVSADTEHRVIRDWGSDEVCQVSHVIIYWNAEFLAPTAVGSDE